MAQKSSRALARQAAELRRLKREAAQAEKSGTTPEESLEVIAESKEKSTHTLFTPGYMADWAYTQDKEESVKKDFDSIADLALKYLREGRTDIVFVKCDPDMSPSKAFAYHSNSVQLPLEGWEQQLDKSGKDAIRQAIGGYDLVRIIRSDKELKLYTRNKA